MKPNNVNTICCADSAYGLLLYFLVSGKTPEETFFFFSDKVPLDYRLQLLNSKFIKIPKSQCRLLHYLCQVYYSLYFPFFYKKHHLNNLTAYGFDFMEWTNSIIYLSKEFYLIEDGFGNYTMPHNEMERFQKSWWRRYLVRNFKFFNLPFGLSSQVKKIYLTGLMAIPQEIYSKVELINLKNLWENNTLLFRDRIIDFFCRGFNIENYRSRSILLLTQCWSEAGIMTESKKVDLYSRIIHKYGAKNITLKIHPREHTNYREIFPELEVITSPIPYQLLDLLGMRFDMAISVNSTAIFSIVDEVKKIILIEEYCESCEIYDLAIKKINDL